jgi:hypothetical protein
MEIPRKVLQLYSSRDWNQEKNSEMKLQEKNSEMKVQEKQGNPI